MLSENERREADGEQRNALVVAAVPTVALRRKVGFSAVHVNFLPNEVVE